jgi:hypothetical protein
MQVKTFVVGAAAALLARCATVPSGAAVAAGLGITSGDV